MCFLQDLQSKDLPNTRIQPDRRWFGNTRVIGQKQLDQFREEMSAKVSSVKAFRLFSLNALPCCCLVPTIFSHISLSPFAFRLTVHIRCCFARKSCLWPCWRTQRASGLARPRAPA